MLDWDAVNEFRRHALNPEHPVLRGQAQNGDIFFQAREACNKYYDAIPETVVDYMNKVNEKIGTDYKPSTTMALRMRRRSSSLWALSVRPSKK